MNNKKYPIILAAALVLLLAAAGFAYTMLAGKVDSVHLSTQSSTSAASGENNDQHVSDRVEAPDFTVYTFDGSPVRLSDFTGKPVVINFWASWCGPCKSEMPDFQNVYEAYADRVDFLMINMTYGDETPEVVKTFIERNGFTFPVYCDSDLQAASLYGASSIPTTFILDRNGLVYGYAKSVLDEKTLTDVLDFLLNE